jgi:mycoredoxin
MMTRPSSFTLSMAERLIVYRRNGCGFCSRLERALDRHEVDYEQRDIWLDDDAAAFVRSVNNGAETVPTVVVGDQVMTNPDPKRLLESIGVAVLPRQSVATRVRDAFGRKDVAPS